MFYQNVPIRLLYNALPLVFLLWQSAAGNNPVPFLSFQRKSEFRSEAEIIDWLKTVEEGADKNKAESVLKASLYHSSVSSFRTHYSNH